LEDQKVENHELATVHLTKSMTKDTVEKQAKIKLKFKMKIKLSRANPQSCPCLQNLYSNKISFKSIMTFNVRLKLSKSKEKLLKLVGTSMQTLSQKRCL